MNTKALPTPVQKMIANIMKARECKQDDAIAYMLGVATGRLTALRRYSDSVPEGKPNKGVRVAGRKKAAPRSKAIKVEIASPAEVKAS